MLGYNELRKYQYCPKIITAAFLLIRTKVYHKLCLSFSGRDTNVFIYIKRRLAMCARKLGKMKEAIKMFREVVTHAFFVPYEMLTCIY